MLCYINEKCRDAVDILWPSIQLKGSRSSVKRSGPSEWRFALLYDMPSFGVPASMTVSHIAVDSARLRALPVSQEIQFCPPRNAFALSEQHKRKHFAEYGKKPDQRNRQPVFGCQPLVGLTNHTDRHKRTEDDRCNEASFR